MNNLFSDSNTYEMLGGDPTSCYKKEDDRLPTATVHYTIDLSWRGHPKAPFRFIFSNINSVTYSIARHLTSIFAELVGNTPHRRKDLDLDNRIPFITDQICSLL